MKRLGNNSTTTGLMVQNALRQSSLILKQLRVINGKIHKISHPIPSSNLNFNPDPQSQTETQTLPLVTIKRGASNSFQLYINYSYILNSQKYYSAQKQQKLQYTDQVIFQNLNGERKAIFYLAATIQNQVQYQLTGFKIYFLGENRGRKCYQLHQI